MSPIDHYNASRRGTSMRSALFILSGVMWGAVGVFTRTLSDWDMDRTTIVLSRVSLARVMMLVLILAADRSLLRFKLRNIWFFFVCVLSMLGLNVFYTTSGMRCPYPW